MPALPQFARFWMVCRKPTGPGQKTEPRQRYSSLGDAREAAADLARSNDHPFIVLEAIEVMRPGDSRQEALPLSGASHGDAPAGQRVLSRKDR